MKARVLMLLLVFMVIAPACCPAAAPVQLVLDRNEALVQDSITLSVRVSGPATPDSPPKIPGLQGFTVTEGGTSSHIEIINFTKSSYIEYIYYLQPRAAGTFRIGPAEVRDGSKVYRSNTVTLVVGETPGRGTRGDVQGEGQVFLTAEVSQKTAYVEEPVIYTVKLYRQVKVSNLALDIPDRTALTFRKIGDPLEYRSVVNGRQYQVLEVRNELIASAAGRFAIGPATMAMNVYESGRRQRGFPYNDPFFGFSTPRPATFTSNACELNVSPLPAAGRPAGFGGLLGRYAVDARLDREEIAVGETATLSVTVEGRGNVNRVPDLAMPDIPGIRIYPDQPSLNMEQDSTGTRGVKTMKWAFVPRQEGTYRIPGLGLSYFDTVEKAYRVIRTREQILTVRPGVPGQTAATAASAAPGTRAPAKKDIAEVGRDILPVHTGLQDLHGGGKPLPSPFVSWPLLLIPPLAYFGVLLGRSLRKPSRRSEELARSRRALKGFLKQCPADTVTADRLSTAVREYFNSRFGSSLGTLTPEEAGQILESHGVGQGVRDRCVRLLGELSRAVYTGQGDRPFDHARDVVSLVRDIDRQGR